MKPSQILLKLDACSEARVWASKHGGTEQELWNSCERGDWMGWYLGKSGNKSPQFYMALAEIVETQCVPVYKIFDKKNKSLETVVKKLRAYAKGNATKEQLKSAYAASSAAAYAASSAPADAAAYVASAAAYAAADAADAIYVRLDTLKQSAD